MITLRTDLIPGEAAELLQAAARATLRGQHGSLADQINAARERRSVGAPPPRRDFAAGVPRPPCPPPPMEFFNGMGGFREETAANS